MTHEQMTNEELAEAITDIGGMMTIDEELIDEAARRLRNSIPKPYISVVDFIGNPEGMMLCDVVTVNGITIDELDGELFANQLRKALGMEGGGDE